MKTQYLLAMATISFILGMTTCAIINISKEETVVNKEIKTKLYATSDGIHWGFK